MLRVVAIVILSLGAVIAGPTQTEDESPKPTGSPIIELEVWPKSTKSNNKLIWYVANDEKNVRRWTEKIEELFQPYKNVNNSFDCNSNHQIEEGKLCNEPLNMFRPCVSAYNFGYHKSTPCIFLRLKTMNWKPENYNSTDDLPDNMPKDLFYHIKNDHYRSDMVWVTCDGEDWADIEHIGPIQYIPRRGFPGHYFRSTNTDGYLSPLVAVFFERPKTGVLINIECKAWAKNIYHNRIEQNGLVQFKLMID